MRGGNIAGLTLIELLVVVVLVGILTAAAIPSYSAYVVRGQRSAAKTALMQAAQFLERNYTVFGCYPDGTAADCPAAAAATTPVVVLPTGLTVAPSDGGKITYAITLASAGVGVAGQSFLLTATPCGAGGACPTTGSNPTFTDPDCGFLTLDNTGAKTAQIAGATATCWRQ
jgi:type IV pilus assembly protein PilE